MTMTTTARPGRSQRWFARWYPAFMARVDERGQADIRHEQLARAQGRVLEIGVGSGLSLPHYPADLAELVLLEPNAALREQAATLAATLPVPTTVIDGDAHALPFDDEVLDTVTASLVLCSVRDPARVLAEIHRVLRPGGRFLFHEHVRGGRVRGALQDLVTPLQRRLADGCHANRDVEGLLDASPLQLVSVVHLRMPTRVPTITPLVVGTATREARG